MIKYLNINTFVFKSIYKIAVLKFYRLVKNKGGYFMNFNKDTKIGEILEVAPEKAEILLEIGMHCLGCPASQMETLEEACEVHGIDVNEVLEKLNA